MPMGIAISSALGMSFYSANMTYPTVRTEKDVEYLLRLDPYPLDIPAPS